MSITELNHFFVRANDLEESRRFYCDGLGLQQLPRPNFSFPGYWLGVEGKAIVHMGPSGNSPGAGELDSPAVDHVAFSADKPERFMRRLRGMGIEPQTRYLPEFKVFQLLVKDPNGIAIELNFQSVESEPAFG